MSLADYLAKNYLTADAPSDLPRKKRKRKDAGPSTTGIAIADDNDAIPLARSAANALDGDDTPIADATYRTAEFRRAAKSAWRTVGAQAPSSAAQAAREADAILAAAAADRAALGGSGDDEAPQVVDERGGGTRRMESGANAGLQTADQVSASMAARQRAEERAMAELGTHGREAETVYRDASGRRIDVAMKRAAARQAAEAELAKKKEAEAAMQGDVQRAQAVERRGKLQDARLLGTARYADDEELNEEQRERERWNDPAAQFLPRKSEARSRSGRPVYKGSAAPNRYGIKPGYRWDGVDRGNGFEGEWFKARNKKNNRTELEYAWQMDE